jgi:tetratricopeptide (TPR) repeat protein
MDTIQLNPKTCKICLNMIVKNEAKVIRRLLETVYRLIDKYCICDTGSTDNTMDIIREFFLEKGIDGEIYQEPFRDFGYNRSYSLKKCDHSKFADIDYILLLDADMYLSGPALDDPDEFKRTLGAYDVYYLLQGSDRFYYKNVRIVRPRKGYYYWGVTHEYVKTTENTTYGTIEKNQLFIQDIGDGGSKTDKFERDIKLLNRGLEEIPNNDRYTFYLANSYRDAGQPENAIQTYKKRIEIGGWIEEVWYSYYSIGKCYQSMNDMPNAIYAWLEGYNYYSRRIETLYEIVQYYRMTNKHQLAQLFYKIADKQRTIHPMTNDYLFLQKDVYDYKLDYEMSIIGYYTNPDRVDLPACSMKVISQSNADEAILRNVLSNYKFYVTKIQDYAVITPEISSMIRLFDTIGDSSVIEREYNPSTPSICRIDENTLAICRRYVNYKIDDKGGYVNRDKIRTKNVIGIISSGQIVKEFLMPYDQTLDNVYVGLEDVRIYSSTPNVLSYNANRGLAPHKITIELGSVDYTTESFIESSLVYADKDVEKNWVKIPNQSTIVYGWSPLSIGSIVNHQFIETHCYETPNFFRHLRGSTNGVQMGDEIWFICHIVSYEDRRYYYHLVVVLDSADFKVKRYTKLFTFEKEKVEYTLGFVEYDPESLLIGYSVMDRETKYMVVRKDAIESMMIQVI